MVRARPCQPGPVSRAMPALTIHKARRCGKSQPWQGPVGPGCLVDPNCTDSRQLSALEELAGDMPSTSRGYQKGRGAELRDSMRGKQWYLGGPPGGCRIFQNLGNSGSMCSPLPREYLMCGDAQGLSGCPLVFVSWVRWSSVAAGSSGSLDKP